MKHLFKFSIFVLLVFCLITLGACQRMHKGPPGEQARMQETGPKDSVNATGQSCNDSAGVKGACDCAQCKGGKNDCQGCNECSGCKGRNGCVMHQQHPCMSAKKAGCGGDGCGKCKEAGCGQCGQGPRGAPGAPGGSCGK